MESMRLVFNTQEWADLNDEDSLLYKSLTSMHFRKFEFGDDRIDKDAVALFGLLYCEGDSRDKALALFHIIMKGGLVNHRKISSTTSNWAPVFEKLCKHSVYNIVYFTHYYVENAVPLSEQYDVI